ncbi:MAG: phage tail tape measure protein [Runella slithyformis]|nr:MAG: phage tail tape measure protein [Runella slithyformis]
MAANDEVIKLRTDIETDQAAQSLEVLKAELSTVNKELRAMGKYSEEWSDEQKEAWRKLKEEQKEYKEELKEFRAAIDINSASFNELTDKGRELHRELNRLTVGSEEWIDKLKEVKDVDKRIADVKGEVKDLSEAMTLQQRIVENLKDGFAGTFAALQLDNVIEEVIDFGKEAVTAAAKVDDAFADIMKTTGMTREEVEALNEQLKAIDTRSTQEALQDISKIGGQIGIAKDEMLGFVKSTDMAAVALSDEFKGGAEEVATTMGTLSKLFKETKDLQAGDAINQIGSAINELGAAGSATGPVVADFTTRLGQLGNLAPQISETMGLGAAFQEFGLSAEIAAGGVTNILLGAAKGADAFAVQMKLTTKEVENLIDTNPNEFFLKLAESFKGLSNTEVAKRLDEMGIKSQEATKVMQLLATQTDSVRQKQTLASMAMKQATSLTNEFNIKNKNAAAELDKAKKSFDNLKVEIGQGLIPAVTRVVGGFVGLINAVRQIPNFVKQNRTELALLATAMLMMNGHLILASANSIRLAAAERGRATVTAAVTIAQRALNLAMTANPIGLIMAAIAALAAGFVAVYNRSQTLRAGIAGLWQAMKTAADVAVQFVKAFITMDIKSMADAMLNGGKKIGEAFGKGYNGKIQEENAKSLTEHGKHIDSKADLEKKKAEAEKARKEKERQAQALAELSEHDRTLTDKEKKSAAHSDKEMAKQKAASEKSADDAIEAEARAKSQISKLKAESIADEKTRKEELLKWEFEQRMADLEKEKVSAATKEAYKKALTEQYNAEIKDINDKYREDAETKAKASAKAIAENEAKLRTEEVEASYNASKAVNDFELLMAGNNATAVMAVKRNRLQIELSEEIRKINDAYTKKAADLAQRKADEIRTAEEAGLSTQQIRDRYAELDRLLKQETDAKKKTLETQYQQDVTKLNEENLAARKEKIDGFFAGLKQATDGDFSYFQQILTKKSTNEATAQQQRLQDFSKKSDEIGGIALQAVGFLKDLNQKYLDAKLKNLNAEKTASLQKENDEMEAAIAAAEAQYEAEVDNASLSADERKALEAKLAKNKETIKKNYEKNVDKINKDSETKEKKLKKDAFERDKKMQIAMALISGGMAFIKALASGFFPVNLVFAALTAAATAVQIASIKRQQFQGKQGALVSPSYVKNAGVLRGGWHGSQYGTGGISMIDRATGEEVGEAEGGEPFMILSRNTLKNNGPLINSLLDSSLNRNGAPVSRVRYRTGGVGYVPWDERVQFRRGGKKARRAQEQAEAEAAAAEAEAGAAGGSEISDDGRAAIEENTKVAKNTEKNTQDAARNTKMTNVGLGRAIELLERIANKNSPPSAWEIGSAVGGEIRNAMQSNL